jgi:hypothetical protein
MAKQLLFLALVPSLLLQAVAPERKVSGTTTSSSHDPNVQIQLPKSAEYVGADRWILYDIADCELHAFVEADADNNVQRLYWIQFEGYVPSRPDLTHTYDSPRHTTIDGLDFYVDTWPRSVKEETRSGSDREHIEKLIRDKGYKMPAGMMYVRLVHLLDQAKRKELMIIYGEDLAPTGYTAADLKAGGKSHDRWSELANGLIARAKSSIRLASPHSR